jgi:hypothetical protein
MENYDQRRRVFFIRSPGPPVETPPPMRSRRDRSGAIAEGVGAEFERVAGVFERGGREPMEGSVGLAGEEVAPRRSLFRPQLALPSDNAPIYSPVIGGAVMGRWS